MKDKLIIWAKDSSVEFTSSIHEGTGFMHVDAIIARTGIQKYLASEVGEKGNNIVGVMRPANQVTHADSVESFTNIPMTDNHPNEMVTINNHRRYSKGSISSVSVIQLHDGETGLKTKIVITDKSLIEAIKNGKKELSVGYENILVQKDGVHNGEKYSYIQTDIRANHVAVVDAGRCGSVCKLMIDKSIDNLKKGNTGMTKIEINGTKHEVSDEVAEEFKKLSKAEKDKKDAEEEKENMKKDMEKETKKSNDSMDKMQATIDTLSIEKSKQSQKLRDSSGLLDAQVIEKLNLLKQADSAGAKCKTSDSALEIKQAIVKAYGIETSDQREVYLDAVISIKAQETKDADTRKQKAHDSFKKIGEEYTPHKTLDVVAIGEQELHGKGA